MLTPCKKINSLELTDEIPLIDIIIIYGLVTTSFAARERQTSRPNLLIQLMLTRDNRKIDINCIYGCCEQVIVKFSDVSVILT